MKSKMNQLALRARTAMQGDRRQTAQPSAQDESQRSFRKFSASQLFCPKCNAAMPVRERMLLVLPSGTLYDLLCERCHTSLGTRTA